MIGPLAALRLNINLFLKPKLSPILLPARAKAKYQYTTGKNMVVARSYTIATLWGGAGVD